jgi:anti-sigma regulatory factor (Ser/Thr protein kinase)
VRDNGPGIENIELAMKEGYSTATEEAREMGFGAGMGLPNIKKNSDSLKIDSEKGKGTLLAISFDLQAGG